MSLGVRGGGGYRTGGGCTISCAIHHPEESGTGPGQIPTAINVCHFIPSGFSLHMNPRECPGNNGTLFLTKVNIFSSARGGRSVPHDNVVPGYDCNIILFGKKEKKKTLSSSSHSSFLVWFEKLQARLGRKWNGTQATAARVIMPHTHTRSS